MNNNIFEAINIICEAENNESEFCVIFGDYSVSGCRVNISLNSSDEDYKVSFELTDETYLNIYLDSVKISYGCCLFNYYMDVAEFKISDVEVSDDKLTFKCDGGEVLEILTGEDYE